MKAKYYTNTGKQRNTNQDGIIIDNLIVTESMESPQQIESNIQVTCIADGMGGKKQGEIATQIWLKNLSKSNINNQDKLKITLENTQNMLKNIDTGCATAGIVFANENFVFNVGDCRVYKKEGEFLNKLTHDHSVIQQLIDSGEITEEESIFHPKGHILTSAIMPDIEVQIYMRKIKIFEDDIFFLCSDGIWGEFEIEELEKCFKINDIEVINDALEKVLKTKKQKDNLSYILLKV